MAEKKSMQNVRFDSMRELLEFLPEHQLEMVQHLRELIKVNIPHIEERLSFNVPFYKLKKGICYIWPGAVSWGNKTYAGVEFGFQYGYLLADEAEYLDRGNRKQVYSKRFLSVEEIDDDILSAYLREAAELDEIMYREKKRKK